jgi:hypothetical protein
MLVPQYITYVGRAGLLAITFAIACPATAQRKINWSVTPYVWATKTSYELTADGSPVDAGTVSFSNLMDTTDASFQIVIEAGRDHLHEEADITVTSVLQTSAGRMVFGRYEGAKEKEKVR